MSEHTETSNTGAGGIRAVDGFDPRRFVSRVGGADYLEVKWRLYWLRVYDPDASVVTELLSHENNVAVFKATITLSNTIASSTAHGSEGYDDFRDYLEKAETKAIGRALAGLGFGTQFTPDYDFEQGSEKVVDAPVRLARQNYGGTTQNVQPVSTQGGYSNGGGNQSMTDRQMNFIRQMAREKGLNEQAVDVQCQELYGKPFVQLERRDASAYIERLKSVQPVNQT